jgi:hypothetical protein
MEVIAVNPAAKAAQPTNHINTSSNHQAGNRSAPIYQTMAPEPALNLEPQPVDHLLDKEDLTKRLKLPNRRALDDMIRRGQIPVVYFSAKTTRFIWSDVLAALRRLSIPAVSGQ